MASQSRVRIDDRLNEGAEGLAVPKGPGELMHPDDLAVRREEFHLHAHGPGSDGRASDKGFASRRGDLHEELPPPSSAVPRKPIAHPVSDVGYHLAVPLRLMGAHPPGPPGPPPSPAS